ncbi:transposase protein, partial [mine drainage metagenome]
RLVKELRLRGACTIEQANEVLERYFLPEFNRRFTMPAAKNIDAHRPVNTGMDIASILSVRDHRVISSDYTFRYDGKIYQIPAPALPGMRGGQVIIENRLDGQCVFRFGGVVLKCQVVVQNAARPTPPIPQPESVRARGASKKVKGRR